MRSRAPFTGRSSSSWRLPLLDGYRGRPPADVDAVCDLVMRVGALAAAHPAVAELDLNPVIATPEARSSSMRVSASRLPAPRRRSRR